MICLSCGHYTHPDREMARVQGSDDCTCSCHPANNRPPRSEPRGAGVSDGPHGPPVCQTPSSSGRGRNLFGRPGPHRRDLTQPQEGAACGTRGRGIRSACRTAVHDGRPKRSSLRGRIGIDVGGRTKLTHGSGASAAQNNAGNLGTCGHHATGGSTAADGGLTSSTRATPMVRVPSNRWTPGETGASSSPDREHRGSTPARRIPAATTAKANRATRADSGLGATCGGRGFDSRRLHCRETGQSYGRPLDAAVSARDIGQAWEWKAAIGCRRAPRPRCMWRDRAAWSAHRVHNPEVAGSNPAPAIDRFDVTAEREGSTTARRLGHLSRTIRTPNVTAVRHASYPPGALMPSTRPMEGAR